MKMKLYLSSLLPTASTKVSAMWFIKVFENIAMLIHRTVLGVLQRVLALFSNYT